MKIITTLMVAGVCTSAFAQIGIDGLLGAEWASAIPVSVGYNSAAPIGNFGTPTSQSNSVAYDIYTRADANYLYGLFLARPVLGDDWDNARTVTAFANIYLDTNPFISSGSDLGIEINNSRAFKPGVGGYYGLSAPDFSYAMTTGTSHANGGNGGAIEFALSWAYLGADPSAIGFPAVSGGPVRFQLSQAWGYSVAGGAANYGTNRLGLVQAVPEPGTMTALALGAAALLRKRRKA